MAMTAVLIPAAGYRGDRFLTYAYKKSAEFDARWEVLEGEILWPGREITEGALRDMLSVGSWHIRAKSARRR